MDEGLDVNAMFGAALGLANPWQVVSVVFGREVGRLDVGLGFRRGAQFACPEPGCAETACSVHDTIEKTWRHLDFFEHRAYLSARVPRVRCREHGVRLVSVPWARPGSGFTLLFEVVMVTYAKQMPIAALARMAQEHDTRIWRIVEHHVSSARAGLDFSSVNEIGIDETSARRGQDDVSIFMDLQQRRVMGPVKLFVYGSWSWLEVGVDAFGVRQRELCQGLLPVGRDVALDELAGDGGSRGSRRSVPPLSIAFSGALVLDVADRQPQELDDGLVVREVPAVLDDLAQLVVQ